MMDSMGSLIKNYARGIQNQKATTPTTKNHILLDVEIYDTPNIFLIFLFDVISSKNSSIRNKESDDEKFLFKN